MEGSDVSNPAPYGDWPWNGRKVTARTIGTKSWGLQSVPKPNICKLIISGFQDNFYFEINTGCNGQIRTGGAYFLTLRWLRPELNSHLPILKGKSYGFLY